MILLLSLTLFKTLILLVFQKFKLPEEAVNFRKDTTLLLEEAEDKREREY